MSENMNKKCAIVAYNAIKTQTLPLQLVKVIKNH